MPIWHWMIVEMMIDDNQADLSLIRQKFMALSQPGA
jgi:hypothetical protein